MDWYYPVLSGAVSAEQARQRIDGRWSEFVLDGVGVRCVADHHWVTAAETAECAMALDAIGMRDRATSLLRWTRHLRDDDGAYWTGCVHPDCVRLSRGRAQHLHGRGRPARGSHPLRTRSECGPVPG